MGPFLVLLVPPAPADAATEPTRPRLNGSQTWARCRQLHVLPTTRPRAAGKPRRGKSGQAKLVPCARGAANPSMCSMVLNVRELRWKRVPGVRKASPELQRLCTLCQRAVVLLQKRPQAPSLSSPPVPVHPQQLQLVPAQVGSISKRQREKDGSPRLTSQACHPAHPLPGPKVAHLRKSATGNRNSPSSGQREEPSPCCLYDLDKTASVSPMCPQPKVESRFFLFVLFLTFVLFCFPGGCR